MNKKKYEEDIKYFDGDLNKNEVTWIERGMKQNDVHDKK
jgi:hypothetical protein